MAEPLFFQENTTQGLPDELFPPVTKVVGNASAVAEQYSKAMGEDYNTSLSRVEQGGLEDMQKQATLEKQKRDTEAVKESIKTLDFSNKAILEEAATVLKEVKTLSPFEKIKPNVIEKEYLDTVAWDADPTQKSEGADQMAWYNTLQRKISEIDKDTGVLNYVMDMGREIVNPGWSSAVAADVMAMALGKPDVGFIEGRFTTVTPLVEEFRDTLNKASPEEKNLIVGKLIDSLEKHSGVFTKADNIVMLKALNLILDSTKDDRKWDVGFNVLGAATVPGIATAVKLTAKLAAPARILSSLGKDKEAGNLVARDILDKAKDKGKSGLSEDERIKELLPLYKSPLEYSVVNTDGLSAEAKVALIEQESSRTFQDILKFQPEVGVTKEAQEAFTQSVQDTLKDSYGALEHRSVTLGEMEGLNLPVTIDYQHHLGRPFYSEIEAARWAEQKGLEGFKVKPVEGSFGTQWVVEAQDVVKMTKDGILPHAEQVFKEWKVAIDPRQYLMKDIVDAKTVAVHKQAKIREDFNNAFEEALSGLSKKQRKRIASVMEQGNKESEAGAKSSHIYSSTELDGMGMVDMAEKIAYWKASNIRNLSYHVHNKALVDSLNFLGFKELSIVDDEGKIIFQNGGEKLTTQKALTELESSGEWEVLDFETNGAIQLSHLNIADYYDKEYSVVKLLDEARRGSTKYKYGLVRNDKATFNDWTFALNYRPGETARAYTDPYFTVFKYKGTRGGKQVDMYETVATSGSRAEASTWVANRNKALGVINDFLDGKKGYVIDLVKGTARVNGKFVQGGLKGVEAQIFKEISQFVDNPEIFYAQIKNGEIPRDAVFDFKFDREQHGYGEERIREHLNNGRLLVSKRGERLASVAGGKAPVLNVVESIAKEIDYVARFANVDLWKHVAIQRWMETVGQNITRTGEGLYKDFMEGELKFAPGSKERAYLERERQYIKNQLGFMTKEQQWVQQKGRQFAEWVEGVPLVGPKLHKTVLSFRGNDPVSILRAMNFHSTLGMFNLSQLMVQGAGAFVAASIHPLYGLKAAQSFPLLRLALMTDNEAVISKLASMDGVFGLGIGSKADFKESVELIRRSGILSSIRSTALYDAGEGAIDMGFRANALAAGVMASAKEGGRKLIQVGAIPFNRGEEFARMVSMDIARREWKAANKGASVLSEKAIKEITARADAFTLSMTTANRMAIQRGLLSIPFQFLQYPIKLASALLGKKTFTWTEKVSILAGQGVLYGTAAFGIRGLTEELLGGDASSLNEEQKVAITQGAIAGLMYAWSDGELAPAIGSRLGTGQQFVDLYRSFFEGRASGLDLALGPTKGLLDKTMNVTQDLLIMFQQNEDISWDEFTYGASKIGELSTGWKNWKNSSRILFAQSADNYIRTKGQQRVAEYTGSQAAMKIFGFPSIQETEVWENLHTKKVYDEYINDLSSSLSELWVLRGNYIAEGNDAMADETLKRIQALTAPLPYTEFMVISSKAASRVSGHSMFEKMLVDLSNRQYTSMPSPLSPFAPLTGKE